MKHLNAIAIVASFFLTAASVAAVRSNVEYVAPAAHATAINGIPVTNLSTVYVTATITTLAPVVVTADSNSL
jgi:hypothetical protein